MAMTIGIVKDFINMINKERNGSIIALFPERSLNIVRIKLECSQNVVRM